MGLIHQSRNIVAARGAPHPAYPAFVIKIERITPESPLFASSVALRELVLLNPIGYDHAKFVAEYPSVDERAEHFVAVFDHPTGPRVVGCLLLLTDEQPSENGQTQAKVMQMAVDPQRQGEGLGRRLVVAAEARAFGLHASVRARADVSLSFGSMVWPHMLARVMLTEQLYRAATILAGTPYHRD